MTAAEEHSNRVFLEENGSLSLSAAVESSLADLPHLPRDRAAIAALRLYATLLDDAVDRLGEAVDDEQARDFGRMATFITKVGPRFERMIDLLAMAPGSRPVAPKDPHVGGDPASAALERLRAGGAAVGFDPAAAVDPAVTEADTVD